MGVVSWVKLYLENLLDRASLTQYTPSFKLRSFSLLVLSHVGLALAGGIEVTTEDGRQTCTMTANGSEDNDTDNILEAFDKCGNGGSAVFPEDEAYWIGTKLNPVVSDVTINWRGELFVSHLPPIPR